MWTYIWGSNVFSSRKAYKQLSGQANVHPVYKWIWKSSCQPKHKVFFWLLVTDRLSTRNILGRRHMHLPSFNCVLCSLGLEDTVDHLFLECPFAKNCWSLVGLTIVNTPDMFQRFESLKQQLNVKFFMEVIIILCWSIWTIRNDAIFRGLPIDCLRCLELFKFNFGQLLWRAKKKYFPLIESWLQLI